MKTKNEDWGNYAVRKPRQQQACTASETLSDGSLVWSVILLDVIRFDCITERDAIYLANKLEAAIEEHTTGWK